MLLDGTPEEPTEKRRNQRLEALKGRGFKLGSRALSKLQRRKFFRKF